MQIVIRYINIIDKLNIVSFQIILNNMLKDNRLARTYFNWATQEQTASRSLINYSL